MKDNRELEHFVEGIRKASVVIRSEKPDFTLAPIVGSVPLVDVFCIVDRHFELDGVEYPPNSSRFVNRSGLMSRWYDNFLRANFHGEKMKLLCIDEVVSGTSAVKGYQEFLAARERLYRQIGGDLRKKITYGIVGISEPANRNSRFKSLENKGIARTFDVGRIITMDDIALNPIRLKVEGKNSQGRNIYLPEVDRFEVSNEYLTFLQNIAAYVGVDPATIRPCNFGKIVDSLGKYLA